MKPRVAFRGFVTGAIVLLGTMATLTAPLSSGVGAMAEAETATPALVVDGAITGGKPASFDLALLRSLPAITLKTSTPWTDGENEFEGVRLRDLLDRLGARGEEVIAAATDAYAVHIPMEDVRDYDVIVAYALNGKPMPANNKGPLWVVYPFSHYHALQKDLYYSRSVWQLTRLTVR